MELSLYTDGGSRENGGIAAIAWIIDNASGQILGDGMEVIGPATNNQAEYRALIAGLKACLSFRPTRIRCYSDSQLMVRQLNRIYKVREAPLKPLYAAVRELEQGLEITYRHVPREYPRIQQADRALRAALNTATRP